MIKHYCKNKIATPKGDCNKREIVSWLVDHLGSFISIIPDL